MRKRPYRATEINQVPVESLVAGRDGRDVHVGVDVAKEEFLLQVRWGPGDFERPWKARNPGDIRRTVEALQKLGRDRKLRVAMESSGVYGDPFRQALSDAGLDIRRVSGKAVKDYEEIFDGVPSQHDGKAAAMIAELCSMGKSSPWPLREDPLREELSYFVRMMDIYDRVRVRWTNRLEALLGRHWPELTEVLGLGSVTILRTLGTYGGPAEVRMAAEAVREQMRHWGGPLLDTAKVDAVVASARTTVGVRYGEGVVWQIRETAQQALAALRKANEQERELRQITQEHQVIQAMGAVVGVPTACVLWCFCGNPGDYSSGPAYRKAMGLNLKVHQSGKHTGKLKLTKRGPSLPRRWLYFAALRYCQSPAVKRWYDDKVERSDGVAGKALTAIMRKLPLALYSVAVQGERFDENRLFDQRRGRKSKGNQDRKS